MNIRVKRASDEIASDIEAIRNRIDTTLDEIEDRLKPSSWLRNGWDSLALQDKSRYLMWAATMANRHRALAGSIGVAVVCLGVLWHRQANGKVAEEHASLQRFSRAIDAAKSALRSASSPK